ncbi:MAG: hypothetical protein CSA33_02185 [Desulfobulbus propionicus]|nr:MAG: hypothetical protein CSA33_02185 [Desulfobulbus propionicus]
MNLKKNYISSASAQSLGRICTMAANFLIFILAARLLGAELFGQYAYVTVFLGLAILVAEFGTNSVLASDIVRAETQAPKYWGNFILMRVCFTLTTMALSIPVAWLVRPDLFSSLVIGLVGLLFLNSRFFDPIYQIFERPWLSFWASALYAVMFAMLSGIVLVLKRPLEELIGAYVLANIIYTVFAAWISIPLIRPVFKLQWSLQQKMMRLAFPVGISGLFTLVHTKADTFMLAFMQNDTVVGIYNSAYRFLDMAVIMAVMLSNPLVPIFSQLAILDRERLRQRYSNILEILSLVIVPFAVIVPLLSKPLVALLFSNEYQEAALLLNIMAWIGVLSFYSLFNFVALLAVKEVNFQIWLGGLTASLNVFLNAILIPKFSFYGSAWATLLVECVFVVVSFLYLHKSLGKILSRALIYRLGVVSTVLLLTVHCSTAFSLPTRLGLAVTLWLAALILFKSTMWQKVRI